MGGDSGSTHTGRLGDASAAHASGFGLSARRSLRWLATPRLLHWLMPYLIALIALGTVEQKSIGLYASQQRYFDSLFFWFEFLPLPGGKLVTALLLISLLAKIIVASPWTRATSGIFVAHLGVALLLLGGLLTALFSSEGYVALSVNTPAASSYADYHDRELTIRKNGVVVSRVPFEELSSRLTESHVGIPATRYAHEIPAQGRDDIHGEALPFSIRLAHVCANCTMAPREGGWKLHGPAQKVQLVALPPETDDERNLAGVEVVVSGAGAADGTYLAFEPMRNPPGFTIGADRYQIAVGRVQHALPFSLTLVEAQKQLHPGTELPRSYRSVLRLNDGAVEQRAELTMNHPLRYKGFTVYQSSFLEVDGEQMVSFAVVRNAGRVFPYVASVVLCIGLLMHLWLRLPGVMKRGAGCGIK